jgi:hypothetical protein
LKRTSASKRAFRRGYAERTNMRTLRPLTIALAILTLASAVVASAQSTPALGKWTPLTNQPGVNLGPMLQLRDGRILVHEEQTGNAQAWHILTPDASGSYVKGTWSSGGLLPSGYAPFYFGSQVLLDGKTVVIEGGEYNFGSAVWTTLGAIGTASGSTFTWVLNTPPSGWTTIGDAQSVILADGRYMQANCCTRESAFFNGPNSWTASGLIAGTDNDEQGYTLLSSGKVLSVEAWSTTCFGNNGSELFDPSTNTWACAAATPTQMWDNSGHELGPAVLMYNGKVFLVGATNASAVYNPTTNTWAAGPTPPNGWTGYDAPASVEPNGKVLEMVGPSGFAAGCQFMEYSPSANTLTNTANPANCPGDPTFVGHLMLLPTGQIMFTDFSGRVEVYTPVSGVVSGVAPVITSTVHTFKTGSSNNVLKVKNLNGLSQGSAYGDDYQPDTNKPLVRVKNASGHVYYARTHDDSTHSIAPGTVGTTMFDLPTIPTGTYSLYVVANGIASKAFAITVTP